MVKMNDLGLRGQVDVHDVEPKADDGLETKIKLQNQRMILFFIYF